MQILLRVVFAAVVLAAMGAGAAYLYLRLSLPQVEGEIRVAGLAKPAEVLRDAYGVPHIYAQSLADVAHALGYVHAQDRLWQMEVNRRTAAGRLSEIFGPSGLEADRFLRTLGVRRSAEANLKHLDEQTRDLLDAYAAGVNAFLQSDPVLPVEFWLTGARPEPWAPADSLGWIKMMAWDLGGNWKNELLRLRLAKTLPLERIHEILPPYPGETHPPLPDLRRLYDSMEREGVRLANRDSPHFSHLQMRKMGSVPLVFVHGLSFFSYDWVPVASALGRGAACLDMRGFGDSDWAKDYSVPAMAGDIGALLGHLGWEKAIVVGHSMGARNSAYFAARHPRRVAGLALVDYSPENAPAGSRRVAETLAGVPEVFDDVRLQVRVSRHGPVISDVSRVAQDAVPRGHVLAMQWTALREDDLTMQSAMKIARAQDWPGFINALRDFHSPQQSAVYADLEGNIGFVAAGRVPLRKPDNDLHGMAPAPGWLAKYDWAGFVPFSELPHAYNPADGQWVTANQRITPPGYAHHISSDWQPPYRAHRIAELLRAVPAHSIGTFARIQGDVVSLPVRELLPRLLETRPASDEARRALGLLAGWDGVMAAERPEPLIAAAWWREFARAIYADELGEAFRANWLSRAQFVTAVLTDRDGQGRWCDDTRTQSIETCDALLTKTLDAALADLRQRYGGDMPSWRWGAAHYARHEHRPFGQVGWLARWFDIEVPTPGDPYTVNVGRNRMEDEARPFANTHAASLRAIYDLSALDNSLYIHSGGQSGNILSPHYKTFTEAWARGDYIPMVVERRRIEAAGVRKLVLRP